MTRYVEVKAVLKNSAEVIWYDFNRDEIEAARNMLDLMRGPKGSVMWEGVNGTVIVNIAEISAVEVRTRWK